MRSRNRVLLKRMFDVRQLLPARLDHFCVIATATIKPNLKVSPGILRTLNNFPSFGGRAATFSLFGVPAMLRLLGMAHHRSPSRRGLRSEISSRIAGRP